MDSVVAAEVGRFREYLVGKGYSKNVVKNYGFRLSTFLKTAPEVLGFGQDETRCAIEDYIGGLAVNTARTIPAGALRTWWSSRFGVRYKPDVVMSGFASDALIEAELVAYRGYLDGLGRLAASTVKGNVGTVAQFLYSMFPAGRFDRGAVTYVMVVDFLTATMAHATAKTRAGQVTRIRSYARFLRGAGVDIGFLDQISFRFPNRRERLGFGCLPEASWQELLAACDATTERGSRDLAMICCLGILGLRACDVAGLRLDDVDWRAGVLSVKDSKSKTERRLPLDETTGAALQGYVACHRRRAGSRWLFLGNDENPITSTQVQTAVRLAAGRASIPEYHGTHGLRRMVATNMINAGVDIKVIADVLGHERIATTTAYTSVNVSNLRLVAAPWPGEDLS